MIRFTSLHLIEPYQSLWEVEDEVIQVSFFKTCLGCGKSKTLKTDGMGTEQKTILQRQGSAI